MKRPPFLSDVRPGCGIQVPATMGGSWALIIFLLFSRGSVPGMSSYVPTGTRESF